MKRQLLLSTTLALLLFTTAVTLAGEPVMIKDIRPGASSSSPIYLTEM